MPPLLFDRLKTPIGEAVLACDEAGRMHLLDWSDCEARWRGILAALGDPPLTPARDPLGVTSALRAYFDGELKALDALSVAYTGTDFRNRVWKQLRKIPAGKTRSYGDLAARLASAPRAVGGACGANPVSLVIPCHRAVGTGGALTGYAGGIARKRWLLAHEKRGSL